MPGAGEFAGRTEHANLAACLEIIVQPVRHLAARHALHRDGDGVRTRGRRRDGVAAVNRFAVYLQFQRDELARLERKGPFNRRTKEKTLYVVRFLTNVATDERVVGVAIPTGGKRAPELGLGDSVRGGLERRLIAHHLFLRWCFECAVESSVEC